MKDRETLKEVLRIILQRISAQDRELASRVQGSFAGVMDEVGYRDRRAISFYRRFSIAAVAAAAVIGVFFTVTLVNIGREHNEEAVAAASWTRLTVPEGEHVDMTLSDGTRLYVNSGSEVEIPSVFDPEKRKIRMTGEVYLEVAKDAERPFFVETEDFDVRVYGTSFNVSAYPEDGVSSVVLVEGSVAVSAGDMTRFIEPGQKMEISGGGPVDWGTEYASLQAPEWLKMLGMLIPLIAAGLLLRFLYRRTDGMPYHKRDFAPSSGRTDLLSHRNSRDDQHFPEHKQKEKQRDPWR